MSTDKVSNWTSRIINNLIEINSILTSQHADFMTDLATITDVSEMYDMIDLYQEFLPLYNLAYKVEERLGKYKQSPESGIKQGNFKTDIIVEIMEKEINCLDPELDKDLINEWTEALNKYKQTR